MSVCGERLFFLVLDGAILSDYHFHSEVTRYQQLFATSIHTF
jgi:hypothetical protein